MLCAACGKEGNKMARTVRYIEVIADDGGGLTLQVGQTWRHVYDDSRQLADDLKALVRGEHPLTDWDGNEADQYERISYDADVVRNGGYRWYTGTPRQVVAQIAEDAQCGWRNVEAVAAHMIDDCTGGWPHGDGGIAKAIKDKAKAKGYRLQVSQHSPEGYEGAYSLECFGEDGKPDRCFGDWATWAAARRDIADIVEAL